MQSILIQKNPLYLLYSTHCGFAKENEPENKEGAWVARSAVIIDEAHNLENHLSAFAESDIDIDLYNKNFNLKFIN